MGRPRSRILHPSTVDSLSFTTNIPALPPGKYRLFADIVDESGMDQTLTTVVNISDAESRSKAAPGDSDDAWSAAAPVAGARSVALADGSTLRWIGGGDSAVAGRPAGLRFVVEGPGAGLEPYMGMAGHAVVMRDDGSVFVHLHPMGTVSQVAQQALVARQPGDTANGAVARRIAAAGAMPMGMAMALGDTVDFPYAFPRAGRYDVWVQVKRHGRILTAPFLVDVRSAGGLGS